MKSRHIKIIVAALAVMLVAAVAVSQTVTRTHMHGGGMFGQHMLGFYTDYLDLTDAQQVQAKDILAKEKTALGPVFDSMRQSHQAMRQLEESGAFDEAKVRALATQQSQNITELIVQKARTKSELFQILTADQKAKLIKLEDRHQQMFMKHMPAPAPGDPTNQ
jgi:Spy/CpxP family protein refolding chaperone